MAEGGVPDVETQKTFIANQIQKPLIEGEIWYVVDSKWLKQWKSYVGYASWDHYNVGEASSNPGPIDNSPLFEDKKLKEHLIDDLDYTLIPDEGWNKLLSWYGMVQDQEPQFRKVIMEGVYEKSLKVEVYPWTMKICENSKPDEQICIQFSKSDTIEQLEKVMRQEFSIPDNKEVKLWNRYMTNMYEPLNKKENTLQDAGLYNGQVIVVEQKNDDGTWPRQKSAFTNFASGTSTPLSTSGFLGERQKGEQSKKKYENMNTSAFHKAVTHGPREVPGSTTSTPVAKPGKTTKSFEQRKDELAIEILEEEVKKLKAETAKIIQETALIQDKKMLTKYKLQYYKERVSADFQPEL